ncbi:MAG: hypothetical protein DHS20C18_48710 [Saprospiraceae bacterium]|nr:MAG: hypothetical protein DHS20C18_48710 [Saprospiraceae bacterium]
MMPEEEKFELIEAYLSDSLSAEQQPRFLLLLKEYPGFQKEIDRHRELQEAIGSSRYNKMREITHEVMHEARKEKAIKRIYARRWLFLAAGVAVLALASWWIFSSLDNHEERLFSQYFEVPASLGIARGDMPTNSQQSEVLQGTIDALYREGAYQEALSLLESKGNQLPSFQSSDYYYWLGILFLKTNQAEKALEALNEINIGHQNEKAWYLALAYLKSGQTQQAKAIFDSITQSNSPYRRDAANVLENLR